MIIEFILLILFAYILGSVPAAYLAARWTRGIDIRKYGSGNVGASNLMKLTSKWVVIPVIVFDAAKGIAAIWAAQLIGLDITYQMAVGLAAIIGHNWPVFLRFNGGRGALTALAVIAFLVPWLGLAIIVVALISIPFHQLALGMFLATMCAPAAAWVFSQQMGVVDTLPIALGLLAIFAVIVIRRLTAPQSLLTSSVSRGELFVNRLLFDRDIRDRETWIHRAIPEDAEQKTGKG